MTSLALTDKATTTYVSVVVDIPEILYKEIVAKLKEAPDISLDDFAVTWMNYGLNHGLKVDTELPHPERLAMAKALRTVQEFRNTLDEITEMLNKAIVGICGEKASWTAGSPLRGIDINQSSYLLMRKWLELIAQAREEANAVLAWEDDGLDAEVRGFQIDALFSEEGELQSVLGEG